MKYKIKTDNTSEVIVFKDVESFLERCEAFMLNRETENNLILGLADAMVKKSREVNAPLFLAVIENDLSLIHI